MIINLQLCLIIQNERGNTMDGKKRNDVKIGQQVSIVLKEDQKTGKLTQGVVSDIVTNSAEHPHGIKVRLQSGFVGRVKKIE